MLLAGAAWMWPFASGQALTIQQVSLGGTPSATVVGGGTLDDVFRAAAEQWEAAIRDPYTVRISYGWAPIGSGDGVTFNTVRDPTTGRVVSSTIQFSNTLPQLDNFFIDPTPRSSAEYQATQTLSADLGGGVINTARYMYANPAGPAAVPSVPGGAHRDLLTLAVHEIGHALGVDLSTLNAIDRNTDGRVEITTGPFAGTLIPWTTAGGGHPTLNFPTGNLLMDGVFHTPPSTHRELLADADIVVTAEAIGARRVQLANLGYAALPNFLDTSVLTLNGAARAVGGVLQITAASPGQAGSVFLSEPFTITDGTGFSTSFSFRVHGGNGTAGSDGFAFVIQDDPRGAEALGNSGEGLGFGFNATAGNPARPITSSLAIEFDTHRNAFDPADDHVAFVVNGQVFDHILASTLPFALNDGTELHAWLDYNAANHLLRLFLSDQLTRPATSVLSETFDLFDIVGSSAFFGFTAATGGGFNEHDILRWSLVVQTPEPGTLVLLGGFLVMLGHHRRLIRRWP